MSYVSIIFVCVLIITVAMYYFLGDRRQKNVLLFSSILFYSYAGGGMLIFLLLTSGIVFCCAHRIGKYYYDESFGVGQSDSIDNNKNELYAKLKKTVKKKYLLPTLVLLVGALSYCKFTTMLLQKIEYYFACGHIDLEILVPLGVSYYTFSSIGYLLDVYWKKTKPIKNYFDFLLCMIYFPHIVQGPISRYQRLNEQMQAEHRFDYKQFCFGIQLMVWGYIKKLVIADRLAIFTSEVFGNVAKYEGITIVIALMASTFQLYMDFSGCMDIVCGTSSLFGITLDRNFDRPFMSKSVSEFWRRWHITLGTWFKDYVYMPVSTSPWLMKLMTRVNKRFGRKAAKNIVTIIPLSIVWILTGVWHGTGWTYIIWGIYFGTIIICSIIFADFYKTIPKKLHLNTNTKTYAVFQMVRTFILFTIAKIVTAPGTKANVKLTIHQLFSRFNPWVLFDGSLYNMGLDNKDWGVIIIGLVVVAIVAYLQEKGSIREMIASKPLPLRWVVYYSAFFIIVIFGIYGPGYDASSFIYANF